MGTAIFVQYTHLHSLVNLAESRVQAFLHGIPGDIAIAASVAAAGGEAALHQGAQGGFVAAVAQAVALGDLNALLR